MSTGFNTRLKKFLIENILREQSAEAWAHLRQLAPECNDLEKLILKNVFADEAWLLFKSAQPSTEELIRIVIHAPQPAFRQEAEAMLLDRLPLDNESLEIIVKANQSDNAAALLLRQQPDNGQLETIMKHSTLRDEAARMLLKRSPDNDELRRIIEYSSLQNEAWERVLQQSPTLEELNDIADFTDFDPAWEYLLSLKPANQELHNLIHNFSELGRRQKAAAQYVLQNQPNVEDLVTLIQNEQFTEEAWRLLQQKNLDDEAIDFITWKLIRLESVKKNEAAKLLLALNPNDGVLWDIIHYTDLKDEAAVQITQFPLTIDNLADIVEKSQVEPIIHLLSEKVGFDRSQVNEAELIRKIANKLLANPDLLDPNHWHHEDKHCLGGWAISLSPAAQEIEKQYSPEIAASLVLPSYVSLFYADKETVLEALKQVVAAN